MIMYQEKENHYGRRGPGSLADHIQFKTSGFHADGQLETMEDRINELVKLLVVVVEAIPEAEAAVAAALHLEPVEAPEKHLPATPDLGGYRNGKWTRHPGERKG